MRPLLPPGDRRDDDTAKGEGGSDDTHEHGEGGEGALEGDESRDASIATADVSRSFHVYESEFRAALTDEARLRVALDELSIKNAELLHVRKLLLRLELSPIFGSVGLAGYLLSLLYKAVVAVAVWISVITAPSPPPSPLQQAHQAP